LVVPTTSMPSAHPSPPPGVPQRLHPRSPAATRRPGPVPAAGEPAPPGPSVPSVGCVKTDEVLADIPTGILQFSFQKKDRGKINFKMLIQVYTHMVTHKISNPSRAYLYLFLRVSEWRYEFRKQCVFDVADQTRPSPISGDRCPFPFPPNGSGRTPPGAGAAPDPPPQGSAAAGHQGTPRARALPLPPAETATATGGHSGPKLMMVMDGNLCVCYVLCV